ncbi:MAG: hypothetical protein D4R65_07380 [Verrucomicrobiaceae bacterium]|nr:MAG: hypothetical protein D4R65_07380 [Verrucomicrobiaceae bacterium]
MKFFPVILLSVSLAVAEPSVIPKEGDLVQAENTVFVIQEGRRCGIPTFEVFKANGFKAENVIRISAEEMNAIPEGPTFTGPRLPYKDAKEGDLVQAPKGPVFVICDGQRRAISTMETFKANGFKVETVIMISDGDMQDIPVGPDLPCPYKEPKEGDLIKAGIPTVYVIRNGCRCAVPTMELLKSNGYNGKNIIVISDEDMEAIPVGRMVQ